MSDQPEPTPPDDRELEEGAVEVSIAISTAVMAIDRVTDRIEKRRAAKPPPPEPPHIELPPGVDGA